MLRRLYGDSCGGDPPEYLCQFPTRGGNVAMKRRLVDSKFASDLAQLLEPGGKVWVKSDVPAIADEIQQALASVSVSVPALSMKMPFR